MSISGFSRIPIAFLCIAAASCAPVHRDSATIASDKLYAFTLAHLDDKYVEPFDSEKGMIAGLRALEEIDSSIEIKTTKNFVEIVHEDSDIARVARPEKNAPAGWADAGAWLVGMAHRKVPALTPVPKTEIDKVVLDGILGSLDKYSRYLPPDMAVESREEREGFGGIGIRIEKDGRRTVIESVFPELPGDRAGLRAGDEITRIDGMGIDGWPLRDVARKLRGPINKKIEIVVSRPEVLRDIKRTMRRKSIIPVSAKSSYADGFLEIQINLFNEGTVIALERILRRAEKQKSRLKGVILDLRGNPGGLLEEAIATADLFLPGGRIISTRGRHPDSLQIFDATPGEYLKNTPIVVLVNGRTASAAEIVAVALRDNRRAVLIGTTSYGKGSVQTIVGLPDKGDLNITWARIHAPSDEALDQQGVVPAFCTRNTETPILGKSGTENAVLARLGEYRKTRHYSSGGESACPPDDERPAEDLVFARTLLKNPSFYAAAVADRATQNAGRR